MRALELTLISPSQVNTFFACPFKYKLAYIDLAKPLFKPEYDFGRKVHLVIKSYYDAIPDSLTPSDVPIYLSKAWKSVFGEVDDRGIRYMDGFMKFEVQRLSWHVNPRPIAVEREYRRGKLHGVVDAVFMRGSDRVIVDWKTGMTRDPTMDEALMVQGNMYMLLVGASEMYFVFVRYGVYHKLEFNEPFIADRLRKFVDSVREGVFERREGEHCERCEYSLHCYFSKYSLDWRKW